MKIRKVHLLQAACVLLALGVLDGPRRAVPAFWQTSLMPGGGGRFVIRQEKDLTLKYVSARLGAENLEIVPVPFYNEGRPGVRSVAEIARRFSLQTHRPVLAAINGGFFDTVTGCPIGFLLRDGKMEFFNMPQGFLRSMVGFSSPGASGERSRVWVSSPKEMPKAWLDTFVAGGGRPLRSESLSVHHINVPGGKHALALFTPTYGAWVKTPENSIYLQAIPEPGRPGVFRVAGPSHAGWIRIAPDGLIVALHGDSRLCAKVLPPGALIRPRWSLPPEWQKRPVAHGLLAGPRLLASGKIQVTAIEERLDSLKSRDRVALATRSNGEVLLVWAHKNTPGNLSFERLAEVLSGMGSDEAIALDGGNSRAVLAQASETLAGKRYFDGGRPVANALVLAGHAPKTRL